MGYVVSHAFRSLEMTDGPKKHGQGLLLSVLSLELVSKPSSAHKGSVADPQETNSGRKSFLKKKIWKPVKTLHTWRKGFSVPSLVPFSQPESPQICGWPLFGEALMFPRRYMGFSNRPNSASLGLLPLRKTAQAWVGGGDWSACSTCTIVLMQVSQHKCRNWGEPATLTSLILATGSGIWYTLWEKWELSRLFTVGVFM